MEIELRPVKNEAIDIHVKAGVGPPGADLLQVVFEMTRQLPRFCMYQVIPRPSPLPEEIVDNGLTIQVADRPQRIALWLNQCLILPEELQVAEEGTNVGSIELWLMGLRDDKIHCFTATTKGLVKIQTDDSEFAGDAVQSLAAYLGIRELSSEARFPHEERRLLDALDRVKGLREVDARLQGEVAAGTTLLKSIVVRLEDARILSSINDMKKRLIQLKNINNELIKEHEIRMKSNRQLNSTLKELNIGVQRAARLRVGKASMTTVTRCRASIQDENRKTFISALRHGC